MRLGLTEPGRMEREPMAQELMGLGPTGLLALPIRERQRAAMVRRLIRRDRLRIRRMERGHRWGRTAGLAWLIRVCRILA